MNKFQIEKYHRIIFSILIIVIVAFLLLKSYGII
jgi:hypothetical protein